LEVSKKLGKHDVTPSACVYLVDGCDFLIMGRNWPKYDEIWGEIEGFSRIWVIIGQKREF
jgi:hypothetical protein